MYLTTIIKPPYEQALIGHGVGPEKQNKKKEKRNGPGDACPLGQRKQTNKNTQETSVFWAWCWRLWWWCPPIIPSVH